MNWRAGMGGFALLAALAARAGEPAAPLENSRQELKELEKGQAAAAGDQTVGKLRDALPRMQIPAAEIRPMDPAAAERSEKELKKKKDAQKNWLLNGVDSLAKGGKFTSRDARENPTGRNEEGAQPDSSDPDYLLKIYSEQQRKAEARTDAKQAAALHADPLKPFLQGWLADTAARGKFFDEYARKPDTGPAFNSPVGAAPVDNGSAPALPGLELNGLGLRSERSAGAPLQANPYLQGLEMSVLQDTGSRHNRTPSIPAVQPAAAPAAGPLQDPAVAARRADKKPLPSALEDEKKYFPQLKKF